MAPKELKFQEGGALYPPRTDSSRLLLGCRRLDYSASRISTAVEDCNAHVLNLNVTDLGDTFSDTGSDMLVIDLRVNHRSPSAISRSLERYGYNVLMAETPGGEPDDDPRADSLRSRINELLRYIDT